MRRLTTTELFKHLNIEQATGPVTLLIRSIRASDAPALQTLHSRLSSETRYNRFHGIKQILTDQEAADLSDLDGQSQAALVVILPGNQANGYTEEIVGVARYAATEPGEAELAIVIRDDFQGQGLGKRLLQELVSMARRNGIVYLDAIVLNENQAMRRLLRCLDYPYTFQYEGAEIIFRLNLQPQIAPLLTEAA